MGSNPIGGTRSTRLRIASRTGRLLVSCVVAASGYSRRVSASAAASRSAAQRAPGRRPIRSMGPDTDTAAITVAAAVAHRRRHARHPGLAFRRALRPAAPAHLGQGPVGELGASAAPPAGWPRRLYASSTLAPEPAVIGSRVPTGTVSRRPAGGSSAATQTRAGALAAVQLHALAGDLAQPRQHRRRRRQQRVVDLPGEFGQRGAEPPAARRRRGPAAGALPARRRVGARWRGAGRCGRTVRRARTVTRPRRAARPPLCRARRCRYPVSQGDTSVPHSEIASPSSMRTVRSESKNVMTDTRPHHGREGVGRPRRRHRLRRGRRP